jgi:hypothetical protein
MTPEERHKLITSCEKECDQAISQLIDSYTGIWTFLCNLATIFFLGHSFIITAMHFPPTFCAVTTLIITFLTAWIIILMIQNFRGRKQIHERELLKVINITKRPETFQKEDEDCKQYGAKKRALFNKREKYAYILFIIQLLMFLFEIVYILFIHPSGC